jgi:hypothetical protein
MRIEFINYNMYSQITDSDSHKDYTNSSVHSSLTENLLEYRFLAGLGAYLARFHSAMEVLRSDVDRSGHDIVLEANGVLRHVQLKATVAGGKRANVTVNNALALKPSGCVIWMSYDPVSFMITGMRWFGGEPGTPLPAIGDRIARHSKANSDGVKAERAQHRVIAGGKFDRMSGLPQLAERLFGVTDPDRLLVNMLGEAAPTIMREASLALGSFEESIHFAHLIDGYGLLKQMGCGDYDAWLSARRRSAETTGSWTGTTAELWTALFLEHRHWRFAGIDPAPGQAIVLNGLARQLHQALSEM